MKGWRSRVGLCLMRVATTEVASPCPICLRDRLHEAGYAPRGPIEVEPTPDWHAQFDAAEAADPLVAGHPLAATVLCLHGDRLQRHRLVARPACPACGPLQRARLAAWRGPGLPDDALLDPLLGLSSCREEVEARDGDPAALCHAASAIVHTSGDRHAVSARGQGHAAARARLGLMGETVERYAAFRPEPNRLHLGTARTLPWPTVPPDDLVGHDAAQRAMLGHAAVDGRRRLGWMVAQRLDDGGPRGVPAALVYLDRSDWAPEPRIGPSASHGLAAHRTVAQAQAHAADELIERTAMTRAWHTQDFGHVLPPSCLPGEAATLARRCRHAGLDVRTMRLPWPALRPVVLVLLSAPMPPWYLLGAGVADDVGLAAEAALLEAASGWQALVRRPESLAKRPRLRASEGTAGHHRWHAGPLRSQRVIQAFVRGSREQAGVPAGTATPLSPLEALLRLAPDTVVADLTPPDIASAGWTVQRVIAPRLPVYGHGRVGTPRRFQAAFGWPDPPMPHPYR
jgi:thiazole/oxazole-forming peptide maturase SagD family component